MLCHSFGLWCVNEESQPGRDSVSRLAPLGCTCSLPHTNALGTSPVQVFFSIGPGVGSCRSVAVQLPFLARRCLMQSEAGLCRDPGQPWIPAEDQDGGPL